MTAGRTIQGFFSGGRPMPVVGQRKASPAQHPHGTTSIPVDPGRLMLQGMPGMSLPEPVRRHMETALGADFSAVRVHEGQQALRIGALAFTLGENLFFAPGQFRPDHPHGRQLLGHELAHVLQQRSGRVRAPAGASLAIVFDPALEAEADRLGRIAANLGTAQARLAAPAPRAAAAVQPARVLRPQAVAQPLRYARFEGWSRLVNWFSSTEETELDTLERRVEELIEGCRRFVAEKVHRQPALGAEVNELATALQALQREALRDSDLVRAKRTLTQLLERGDRLSTRLAQMLVVEEDVGGRQRPVPGQPEEAKPGNPAELVRRLGEVARLARVTDAGELRELLDFASQWVSDSLLKLNAREEARTVAAVTLAKQLVSQASQRAHMAYYLAVLHFDEPGAKRAYAEACATTLRIDFAALLGRTDALPKPREDRTTNFDPGAIAVAAALVENDFIPDLVVGLPTGGTHAANRLAAALQIRGHHAALWYTRPQGVKAESKAFMEGVSAESLLRPDEVERLRGLLGTAIRRGEICVVVVDDGAVSGKTLEIAREIYGDELGRAFACRVRVVTATVKGGSAVERDTLPQGAPNLVDFVYNFTADRAGPRRVLASRPAADEDQMAATATGNRFTASVPVTVVSGHGSRTVPLNRVLLAKRKA